MSGWKDFYESTVTCPNCGDEFSCQEMEEESDELPF